MESLMPYGTPGLLLAVGGGYVATYYITPYVLEKLNISMMSPLTIAGATGALVAGAGYLAGFQGSEGLLVLGAESAVVSYGVIMMWMDELKAKL